MCTMMPFNVAMIAIAHGHERHARQAFKDECERRGRPCQFVRRNSDHSDPCDAGIDDGSQPQRHEECARQSLRRRLHLFGNVDQVFEADEGEHRNHGGTEHADPGRGIAAGPCLRQALDQANTFGEPHSDD